MRREITVATDGSPGGTAAVRWAAREARRHGDPLYVVHVVDREPTEEALAAGRAVLDDACATARDTVSGISVTPELRDGDVVAELLEESGRTRTLVLGSRGHGTIVGLLVGSVCQQVAGRTHGAVVVVRHVPDEEFGQIVVGFDGSEESRQAIGYAFEEAQAREARLSVVLAWEMPLVAGYGVGYIPDFDGLREEYTAMVETELKTWRTAYPTVDVSGDVRPGSAAAALGDASAKADLVVVGSRGRGAVTAAVLGSVSHDLLHRAHCPVVVVGRNATGRNVTG